MNRTPVHIIASFPRRVKTTFPNHFIEERLPERIFVIENDGVETNVYNALMVDGAEEVEELSTGYLCSSLT